MKPIHTSLSELQRIDVYDPGPEPEPESERSGSWLRARPDAPIGRRRDDRDPGAGGR